MEGRLREGGVTILLEDRNLFSGKYPNRTLFLTSKYMNSKKNGTIIILVLVFGTIFSILLAGFSGFILLQLKHSKEKVAWYQALIVAEGGVNYYRWHLAHAPEDLQDGNDWCCNENPSLSLEDCGNVCGPYIHSYYDPEGGEIGKFSLQIYGKKQCGEITSISIVSVGWSNDFPNVKRKVKVKYVKPTVADFAYLLNSNVWAGSDRVIKGPYHSNGGIRMDGKNKSLVSSALSDWTCTCSFGCKAPSCLENSCPDVCVWDGSSCKCPGIFTTANGNEELFDFPVPPFDFSGITMDLNHIKNLTQSGKGIYLSPSSTGKGYHIILKQDRSIDVYEVTNLSSVCAYDTENGYHCESSVISGENFKGNYPIPSDCGLIFTEDNIWAEGEVNGKIALVSADLINPNKETDVWLVGNITYIHDDNSDGLVLLAQHNNLIGLYVPDNMELDGIYIAQTGHFGRNHYPCWPWWWGGSCASCSSCSSERYRSYLKIFGSIVSNGRVGTKWSSSSGTWVSGFNTRENIYDPFQSYNPPPFLPCISEQHLFREWEEVTEK